MEPVVDNKPKVPILDVGVSLLNKAELIEIVVKWAQGSQARSVMYANAHTLNLAFQDSGFRTVLNASDMVFADGIGVVWAARFLHNVWLEKLVCRVWVESFLARAAAERLSIFILAGKPGVAEAAAKQIRQKIPSLQVVGTHHGFFQTNEVPDLLSKINASQPDIVFLGMGSPFQEKWTAEHRRQIAAPVCCTVGAYFDYQAGLETPVPEWLNRLGLEWLWRLLVDPMGKWQRYVVGNPLYIWRVLNQKFKN